MGDAGAHRLVIRERRDYRIETDVRLQIFSQPSPLFHGQRSLGSDAVWCLLHADPMLANDTLPGTFDKAPAKGLAGGESGGLSLNPKRNQQRLSCHSHGRLANT